MAEERLPLPEAVSRGSRERLAPVLMVPVLFARWGRGRDGEENR
jgi:hypothetical protein